MVASCASRSILCSSRLPTESPMFLSQKALLVASSVASSCSFLMRSLMRPRTFAKWSSPPTSSTLAARAASMGLPILSASWPRRSTAPRTAASAPEIRRRTCSRDVAFATVAFALATATLFAARPTSFLLEPYILSTSPVFRISLASASAVSSPERALERWSHSLARSSQVPVSSSRKARSAFMSSVSSDSSFSASSFSPDFFAESFSFPIFASPLNFFSFDQARIRLSDTALALNSSSYSSFLFSLNWLASDSSVAMMSFERYSYAAGFPGSTLDAATRDATALAWASVGLGSALESLRATAARSSLTPSSFAISDLDILTTRMASSTASTAPVTFCSATT
mmetsp:Transcript_29590/g.78341  ORF Transcript_29590/g.78341 Transcript_29590/m.78341 type:complete len:342 (+) Transcript_29590:759-1784(+)